MCYVLASHGRITRKRLGFGDRLLGGKRTARLPSVAQHSFGKLGAHRRKNAIVERVLDRRPVQLDRLAPCLGCAQRARPGILTSLLLTLCTAVDSLSTPYCYCCSTDGIVRAWSCVRAEPMANDAERCNGFRRLYVVPGAALV